MKKNITIKDVAKEASVHVSTVSRALSPNARASLSIEVVERVRKIAKDMGYRPNRIASGLRTNKTMLIGIIIPDITNSLYPPIVRGVESVLEPEGYASILVDTDSDPKREEKLLEILLERGVDGIIDAAVSSHDLAAAKIADQIPVVTANRRAFGSGIPSVVNDDAGGIKAVFDLLVKNNHSEIGYIGGPRDLSTGNARNDAFLEASKIHGIDGKPENSIFAVKYSEDEGSKCADLLLERNSEITAILCANDRLAIGALEALAERGLECPKDISVTGFNDIPMSDRIPPGLTTVRVLQFDVGRISAELLLKKINQVDLAVPETTIMPVTVIERGSVSVRD